MPGTHGVPPTRARWDAFCPCPDHNQDGDQNPSLRVTLGEDDRILAHCRVGCTIDEVVEALGLDLIDLFAPDGEEPRNHPDNGTALPPDDNHRGTTSSSARPDKANADLCDRAYFLLLKQLPLADEHVAALRRRGLSDVEIEKEQYRTLRNTDRGRAAKAVHQELGDAVFTVPGFVEGDFGITLQGDATGIVVPVRDLEGHIVALKVRRAAEPKYLYLTGGSDGPSPGSPVHIPLSVRVPATVVRVTEGELKANVCVAMDDTPTIGVPGVTQWRSALPVLKVMGAKTVIISFDAPDVEAKAPVFEQFQAFYHALVNEGYEVEMEVWTDE
ncbi:MAG: hypothetical protein JNM56_07280 [Planctomycetia bacterium]|nr:hypothetical protein [Planctomycetia bacterium]